jgi:hypothetical protein
MARYLYRLLIYESVSNWYCSHDVHAGGRAETRKHDRIKYKSMWHGCICNAEFKWIEHGHGLYFQQRLHLLCFCTADSSADSYTFHSSSRLYGFNRLYCANVFKKWITVSVWTEIFLYLVSEVHWNWVADASLESTGDWRLVTGHSGRVLFFIGVCKHVYKHLFINLFLNGSAESTSF